MAHWDFPRSSASINILLDLAREYGLDPAHCLRDTQIAPAQLQDPQAMFSARDELQVARALQQALGDAHGLGLEAGTRYHLSSYGMWGFTLLSSPTLRSAIELGLRYVELTFAFCRIRAEQHGNELWLTLDDREVPADMQRFMIERDAAAIITIQRELFAQAMPLQLTGWRFPEDALRPRYEIVFGPIREFAAGMTYAVIPAELLDLPLPQANPVTAAFCETQCRELLDRRRQRSGISGQVRDLLLRHPGRMPDMASVAALLCLSLRSLHRRLEGEQTSFRALVDEVREALAEELLATRRLSTAQVAERLGYAEPASFLHAFRRWKAMTPNQWLTTASSASGTKFQHFR